jgi:hypothetical protein
MTKSPGTQAEAPAVAVMHRSRLLPPTRYRHPGNMIRLILAGGVAIAAAAPSPGGLGAIEAALVAGLAGVGMQAGPAVSAVLLSRLATYWPPVVPGWLSWRVLLRREYV